MIPIIIKFVIKSLALAMGATSKHNRLSINLLIIIVLLGIISYNDKFHLL